MSPPILPGGVGLTHLKVYDTVAPDGLPGGSPHVHLACTECYCITAGSGMVQTLDGSGFRQTPLEPGQVVWFAPGVIHRLINHGGLEILVVMSNAGLPEAGDFVLTFADDVLADPAAYAKAASGISGDAVFTATPESAAKRRDLAVNGFLKLCHAIESADPSPLERFHALAAALVRPRIPRWRQAWSLGPHAASEQTRKRLDELERTDAHVVEGLMFGRLAQMAAPSGQRKLGVCGTLWPYMPEGTVK